MPIGKFFRALPVASLLTIAMPQALLADHPQGGFAESLVQSRPDPSANFRPIGNGSAVDRFRPSAEAPNATSDLGSVAITSRSVDTAIRQAAFKQDFVAPPVTTPVAPPVNNVAPFSTGSAGTNGVGGATPLPSNGSGNAPLVRGNAPTTPLPQSPSASDLTPIPQPQINPGWATTGNSPLVTGPSGYHAEFWDCGAPTVIPAGGNPFIFYPQTTMPNSPASLAVAPKAGPRPIFTLGQENYNVQLGQGIIGQPTVYVPGQPIRNFFRYLSP
jgi:hypothetical protein